MRNLAPWLAQEVGKTNRYYYVTAQDNILTTKGGTFKPPESGDVGCLKLIDPSDLPFARPSELHDVLGITYVPIHIFDATGLVLCKWELGPPLKRIRTAPERYCP